MEIDAPGLSPMMDSRVLFTLRGADMNSTADQAFTKVFGFSTFIIDKVIVTNASAALSVAVGGLYGAAAKAAPILVSAAQVYAALTTATKTLNPIPTAAGQEVLSIQTPYLSLTTGQGTAATADFYIVGTALS